MIKGTTLRQAKIQGKIYSILLLLLTASTVLLAACSDYAGESPPKQPDPSEVIQGPPTQGKVINAMRGGGYTYMQLEEQGKQFWIASTVINVRRNDIVSWEGASVMTNFKSASLSRNFDEIYFVNAIKIEK